MPFQPVQATALVELLYTLDGQLIENTLYFDRANDYTLTNLQALSGDIIAWWEALLAPSLTAGIVLTGVRATALHDQTGPQFLNGVGLPLPGEVPSDPVPNNVAFCLTFRTALIGRSFRGRNYIAGLPESAFTGSRLSSTVATTLKNAYSGIPSSLNNNDRWIVVSRTVNQVLQENGLRNAVTSVDFVDLVADSQRRRLPGRGT